MSLNNRRAGVVVSAAIKLTGATVSLQSLKDLCQEYFYKVVAIGKPHNAMSKDELATCLEYSFRRHDLLEAERQELDFQIGFSEFAIADIERRLAGHNESAAIFKLCTCEWCVNGWTPERGSHG